MSWMELLTGLAQRLGLVSLLRSEIISNATTPRTPRFSTI